MLKYLVTGGSGFLGVSLIERIIKEGGYVRTVARNEGKLIALKEKFGDKLEICLGDIVSPYVVEQALDGEFEGIFHLAAFKHVPLAETFTKECVCSNVVGTINLLEISRKKDIKFLVGISTDKAAQVAGVYGASKLLMEKMFLEYSKIYTHIDYRIVRYGNVLYSTGSVLCKWKDLIEQGKEVVITSKEATRFFWTIDQAVDLIFDCLKNATDAKPYVTGMKAMAMGDLLEAMIQKYAKAPISVKEIGLQKGENVHEKILEQGPYSNEVELFTTQEIMELI